MSNRKTEGKPGGKPTGKSPQKDARPPVPLPPAPEAGRPRRPTGEDPLAALLNKAAQTKGGPALEALERAAELLASRGEAEQAIWRLEEAVRRKDEGPVDPRMLARLMISLALLHEEHLGRLDRAVELLEQAHKLDPDQPRAIEAGRRIYRAVGDRSRVARLYEVELETAPPGPRVRRGELLVELAEVHTRTGDLVAAATRLEAALPLFSDAARIEELKERLASTYAAPSYVGSESGEAQQLARAAALFRELAAARRTRGDREGEIACFRRALGATPDDLEAATGLEAAYRAAGRDDELARLYRQAPWLPRAARRIAELSIHALSTPPVGTPAAVANQSAARNAAAVDALLAAATAHEPIDDLLGVLEDHLSSAGEAARLADLHERLLVLSDDRDPLDRADRLVAVAKHHKLAGDLIRFEAALLDALASYPGHEEAYQLLAEHLTVRRDHATLVAVAEAALAAAPPDEHATRLEELAELYDKRLGDVTGAVDAWTRRLALGRSDRADSELRRLRVKEDRWAGLVASLERELELASSPELRAEVLRRLGQIHRERHELEKARTLFTQALELRPSDPSLYRTLGEIAELEGRFDELAQLLRRQYRAAKERVEKLNLLRRLAALYEERLGDWEGVQWACDEILTHLPSDRDALRRLEQCHEMKGPEGREGLLRILEAHANAAATPVEKIGLYRRLAMNYGGSGQHDLAADRWERLLRLDKTDAAATWALARTYESLARPADAALAYGRLLDEVRGRSLASESLTESERAEAWRHHARILDQQLADAPRAIAAWNQLLALRPADREALAALTTLHRARGDQAALGDLLARRLAVAESEEAAAIALELAKLLAERNRRSEARSKVASLLAALSNEELREATGRDALVLAVELADADGDARGALVAIERLYFTADLEDRPELARAVAERWAALSPSGPATLLAWERVRLLVPEDPTALDELSARYQAAGLPEAQREIDLLRLDLAEASGERERAVELGEGLCRLIEHALGDPSAAFFQLERVLGAPGDPLHGRVLDGLRALAERSGQAAELARVLGQEPGIEALIERARLFEERLREPKRAFEVVRAALAPEQLPTFGTPSTIGALLLPHLLRLGERTGDSAGVLDALCDLLPHVSRAEQAALFATRAEVRERRSKDLTGALDEFLRAVPFVDPGTEAAQDIDAEIRRLARATRRFEDLLALFFYRAARAPRASEQRHALLDEAAALLESDLDAPRRAFRVRVATLAQLDAPLAAPAALRDELWRLARILEQDADAAPSSGHAARSRLQALPLRTAPPAAQALAPQAKAPPASGALVSSSRPARDDTLEVDLRDLVIESQSQRRDQTMELSLGDLAEVARGAPPPRPGVAPPPRPAPPPLPGIRGHAPPRRAPAPVVPPAEFNGAWLLAAPELDRAIVEGAASAWEELAEVLRRADQMDRHPSASARAAVSQMWEAGAHQIDRAFEELRIAFEEPDAPPSIRDALDALAARHGAQDQLIEILDTAVSSTASSERAIALLLDTAAIRESQGQLDDAEARYRRILGIRPDMAQALERLEVYYRETERWEALAELIERRLNGLMERLPAGPARSARAVELAEIYERLGKKYEAIGTLEALLQREPSHAGALIFLGKLYEAQGQWGKVIASLTRRIDLLEAGEGSATQPESRRLRLRIAKIYEEQLELPERALEAHLALDRAGLPDPEVEAAIERLLEHLGRWQTLAVRYEQRSARAELRPEERVELARRRVELLRDHHTDDEGAPDAALLADALRALAALCPSDDAVLAELGRALGALPGTLEERIELGARRLQLAEAIDADASVRAELLSQLGALEAEAGRRQEAIHTLEQAVALAPERTDALAHLARIREGGEDWHGYADARERQAAVITDDRAGARALIDAASASLKAGADRERARADAELALTRCPADADLLAELRAVFQQLEDDAQVSALLQREIDLPGLEPGRRAELLAQLGSRAMKRGALDEAAAAFHSANEADPGYAPAVHGLADLAARTGDWDDVEALLRYAATRKGVKASDSAAFFRRIAEAASARGNADEAYAALIEADRRQPGDLRTRVQLGRNRFSQNRFREAAQHLGVVAEHPDLSRLGIDAAQALYEGAVAELKIRRPEKAEALLRAALTIDARHELALGLLADQALARGELEGAIELLERQAENTQRPADRAARWERIASVATDSLHDPMRARGAMRQAIAAWDAQGDDTRPPAALLDGLLQLERKTGAVVEAAATAARLLQCGSTQAERARRLRESAALEAALGNDPVARERLAAAYELVPADAETLAGYSALLAKENDDEGVAQLLTRALVALPAPTSTERPARAALWLRLAEARDRLRDSKGALAAYERVLELDPGRAALRLMLLERYGDDPAYEGQVSMHRQLMLEHDPLDVPSLNAMELVEARAGRTARASVLQSLQAVAGALAVGRPIPIAKPTPASSRGTAPLRDLTDAQTQLLEHPDAKTLAEVFGALYEGLPSDQIADLAALGVRADARVSPVSGDAAGEIFAECARLLGNRRSSLYLKDDPALTRPLVMVRAPTAVIVSPALAALPAAELRFHMARALWLTRPEHALAVGLEREQLNSLFMSAVRAFHPRHASARQVGGSTGDADAQQLRKQLPYKVVRRLAELFQREADTAFSSARWRRGVEHSTNRAGLVACGDFRAAARVLRDEGDDEALRELARFALSEAYLGLLERAT